MTSRLINLLTLLLVAAVCVGCVSASYRSGTITTVKPDGSKVTDTYRQASYSDMREGAKGAMEFVSGGGDLLASLLTPGNIALAGGGGLGLLGVLGKLIHSNAKAKGKEAGWEEREKAATVQAPLPVPPSPAGGVG